ncbi:hypothetical protein [Stutzerimonas azotifigens]|uniref:hypothetical protein n=1 Tax=Stutzerimonas azotifigens TaxID=291995 RepID=UPI0004820E78|nr:hypothetical protein [Stutzerimonas azotifigens]
MTTWIIAYNKDGNTSTLKTEAEEKPDMEKAVELVSRHAEERFADEGVERELSDDSSPANRLAERFGITITGITQA